MNALLKFRSRITTEDTYPYSIYIEYALEITDPEKIFEQALEYEHKIIKGKFVDGTCECLGILQIRSMKSWEALDLAEKGIQTISQ